MHGTLDAEDVAVVTRGSHEPSTSLLREMIALNNDKHEQAHARLRQDLRDLERAVDTLTRQHEEALQKITKLAATPPDASSLRFPLPLVILIVAGFLGLGGGLWSFRTDVVNQLTQAQRQGENTAKLMDQQYQTLKDTIKTLDQQQRLQYAEFQTFRQEMARRSR